MLQKHYASQAARNENAFGKLNGEANTYMSMEIYAIWCPVCLYLVTDSLVN